ncbi:MAG: hypothetical protein ACLS69_05215 [Butyricicoccus sp.]
MLEKRHRRGGHRHSDGSVGELLYNAKIYLQTGELLAWTVVIVAVSVLLKSSSCCFCAQP